MHDLGLEIGSSRRGQARERGKKREFLHPKNLN